MTLQPFPHCRDDYPSPQAGGVTLPGCSGCSPWSPGLGSVGDRHSSLSITAWSFPTLQTAPIHWVLGRKSFVKQLL